MHHAVSRDGAAAVAGCRGGEVAVWQVAGDKVSSKPAVRKLGLPTSVCAIATSPTNPDEVRLLCPVSPLSTCASSMPLPEVQMQLVPWAVTHEVLGQLLAVGGGDVTVGCDGHDCQAHLTRCLSCWAVRCVHCHGFGC
jgi:hypothetical protein